jgi:phytoene synthase
MMCVLMRVRDADALARACDLGVGMQLTNIARDVGEDARAGRIYLPIDWFDDAGIDVDAFLANPEPTPAIRRMTSRLLAEAHRLYLRSEAGVPTLPRRARTGIYAARFIYDGIGKDVRRAGFDNITRRAHTSKVQKLGWVAQAALRTGFSIMTPRSPVLLAKPLDEVAFLVDAAARNARPVGRTAALLDVLAQLQNTDAEGGRQSTRA